MYLYFDRSGTLKEMYNPDIERVGNSNVNKLYIYWELAEDLTITGLRTRYKLEDNSNYPTTPDYVNQYTVATSKIPYDKKEDLKFFKFFKDYQFYVVNVPDEVLAKDGAVICSAWFVYGNNIQAMGKFAFAVDGDTEMVKPDYNINIAQWNSLITLLKNNFNFFAVATINGLDLSYYNENSIIWDLSDGKIYQLQNGVLIELGFPYVPIKTTTGEFVYTHNGAVQGEKEFEAVQMTPDTSKIPSSSAVLSSISALAVQKRDTSGLHVYSQNGGIQSELEVDEISLGNDDYSTHIPTSGLVKRAIEEIKNNPDVVDIVETKADLDAYDTSILSDKDIIRVLVDETHDGASTFYRWNLSQQAWDYIGKAGDYYTKSEAYNKTEINSLLLLKSDATNIKNGTGSGSLIQTNTESENTANGLDAIAGGKNCQANGKRSLVYGNGNKSYAQDSIVVGQVNTNGIDGVPANNGVRAIVGGRANGNSGNDNLIFGETNSATGNCTFVHGIGNTVNGAHNLVKGQQNIVSQQDCLVLGSGNKAHVANSILLGQFLTVTKNSKFVFGLKNNEKQDTLVEIANGLSEADVHKSNCFEIYKNGKLRVPQQYDVGDGSYIESGNSSAFEVDAINKTIKVGDTILTESELINIIALKNTKADKVITEIATYSGSTPDYDITLQNNKRIVFNGVVASIDITLPTGNIPLDFMCELVIGSGGVCSVSYPTGIEWSGTDVSYDGTKTVFTPAGTKPYNILFFNNGSSISTPQWQAIVRGATR